MTDTDRKRTVAVPLTLILALATAAGAGYAIWKWQDRAWGARLAAAEEKAAGEQAQLRQEAESWAGAVARRSAIGTFRGFLAGINPALLAERRESLELAAVGLLRVAGVTALHVLRPDGSVLYSSDGKYATTGQADDRAAWALAASELSEREAATPGVVEVAAPVIEGGKVLAIVWLAYRPDVVRDAVRPASFRQPAPAAEAPGALPPASGGAPPAAPSSAPESGA